MSQIKIQMKSPEIRGKTKMQKEYSAKTLEEALNQASTELGIDKENIKYQKVSENNFLGIFKSVKILVSVPEKKEDEIKNEENKNEEASVETVVVTEEIKENALEEVNISEEIVKSINEIASEETKLDVSEADRIAREFVANVLEKMGIEAEVTAHTDMEDETVYVDINGPDMGVLIGKRGQTLDSLQYLSSLVVNRKCGDIYLKVKLDTENYRARRKETLENLAKNISSKVRRTRKQVVLEPMNPYERRLIHSALQNDKYVETHSEGEEPYRRVVVTLKKDAPRSNGHYNNGRGKYNNSKSGYRKNNYYSNNKKRNYPKYNDDSEDYSEDYKADYAAYLESKAASKAEENK